MVLISEPELMMQPHPLLIDHIIESILSYLSVSNLPQLFSLRLVCSQWSFYCDKLLMKKHTLSFGGHKYNVGKLKQFLDHLSPTTTSSKTSLNLSHFPVRRFRLFSDLFQECNRSTVISFLEKCSSLTEALIIFKDINSDIKYHTEELNQLQFPVLKELTFSDRRRSEFPVDANANVNFDADANATDSDSKTLPFLYKIVHSSCNTLTTLKMKFPREPLYEIQSKEELVIKIFSEIHLPHLKKLKLDMNITSNLLETLTFNLKCLSHLHLSLGASQFTPESLKSLLYSLRYSLVNLRLTDLYRRASVTLDLPRLDNLSSFEIHGLELPAYFVSFPEFSYEKMPNLKKLCLNTWAPIKSWEVFVPEPEVQEPEVPKECAKISEKIPGKNLGILSIKGIEDLSLAMNFDCPILMRRIANSFTNVRKLELHFSRGSVPLLQTVFSCMGQLEELVLNQSYLGEIGSNCVDDVLTGMETEECKWILKKKAYYYQVDKMIRKPNLTDLKNLRRFDMFGLRHRNLITDVSAYLVFLKMNHLQILDIGRSELSESCLRDLALKFPQGKFQKYLSKKRMKPYDSGLYKNSVFTSICALQ